LNNVDHVVSNSEYTKNLAINCGVNSSKITIINPGVNPAKELNKKTTKEAENLLKNKSPRLITVSRLDKRKNHEKVIMTLRNLKQIYPNIIYTCVGHGEEEENLKRLVKELGLSEQVLFLKKISQDLKNTLVAKSNIFVMPSIIYKKSVEGFGIAFIEAAQYGIPSIGGKDGGASDAIEHQKNGLICDGNNLDEIYSSINDILNNKKYLEYGKTAKKNSNKFSWDIIIEKYKEILN
jgi:phosphatidylinositol alpha-1,6-mannosyltransferase